MRFYPTSQPASQPSQALSLQDDSSLYCHGWANFDFSAAELLAALLRTVQAFMLLAISLKLAYHLHSCTRWMPRSRTPFSICAGRFDSSSNGDDDIDVSDNLLTLALVDSCRRRLMSDRRLFWHAKDWHNTCHIGQVSPTAYRITALSPGDSIFDTARAELTTSGLCTTPWLGTFSTVDATIGEPFKLAPGGH